MWLRKNKDSYISLIFASNEIQTFGFTKSRNAFHLVHFDHTDIFSVGIVDGIVHNQFFFMDWFYALCEKNKFKKPLVALEGLILPHAVQYELLFSQLGVPFFSSSLKNNMNLSFDLFENKTKKVIKKTDLKKAMSLWGVLK